MSKESARTQVITPKGWQRQAFELMKENHDLQILVRELETQLQRWREEEA